MGDCFSAPLAVGCGAVFCCYGGTMCCVEAMRERGKEARDPHLEGEENACCVRGARASAAGDPATNACKDEREDASRDSEARAPGKDARRRFLRRLKKRS